MANWVIVRIWLPKSKGKFIVAHEAENVGHASIETSNCYASFWPEWEIAKKTGNAGALFGAAKGVLVPDLAKDIEYEGCSPDVEVVLYTLKIASIEQKFSQFEASSTAGSWSLMGRNRFNIFNGGGGQSCSGLVYDLLNSGGIKKLILWDSTSARWAVAPDAIARAVVLAAESSDECALAKSNPLPTTLLYKNRITKPDHSLNPHTWRIGRHLGEPKCASEKSCTLQ